MKKYLFLAALAALFFSCEKPNPDDEEITVLNFSPYTMEVMTKSGNPTIGEVATHLDVYIVDSEDEETTYIDVHMAAYTTDSALIDEYNFVSVPIRNSIRTIYKGDFFVTTTESTGFTGFTNYTDSEIVTF